MRTLDSGYLTISKRTSLHLVKVVRGLVLESPGQQDQLTVAVDRVVEHKLVLPGEKTEVRTWCSRSLPPGHDVVPDVDVLNLRPGSRSVVGVGAPGVLGPPGQEDGLLVVR